jgi:hypothetical protein
VGEHFESSSDRGREVATQVWRSLVGLFGADSVERKYGKQIPREWDGTLRLLKQFELERGLRRLTLSGRAHVPALPEFLRLCREVGGDYPGDAPAKPAALPSRSTWMGDRWDTTANLKLLRHITGASRTRLQLYLEPACNAHLVAAKNLWAADMRDLDAEGRLPADGDDRLWLEAMRNADGAIDAEWQARAA